MKYAAYIIFFSLLSALSAQQANREFTSKTLRIHFSSKEKADAWDLRKLPFEEWLGAVSHSSWIELHKSKEENFYFAIFRSGQHMIFCVNDREKKYFGSSYSIDAENTQKPWAVPSKWTPLKWNITYPNGSSGGQEIFTTWKILEEYSGEMTVRYRAHNSNMGDIKEFEETITWN